MGLDLGGPPRSPERRAEKGAAAVICAQRAAKDGALLRLLLLIPFHAPR
jgi:hypothetical protein